jgi:hypothetical protein
MFCLRKKGAEKEGAEKKRVEKGGVEKEGVEKEGRMVVVLLKKRCMGSWHVGKRK